MINSGSLSHAKLATRGRMEPRALVHKMRARSPTIPVATFRATQHRNCTRNGNHLSVAPVATVVQVQQFAADAVMSAPVVVDVVVDGRRINVFGVAGHGHEHQQEHQRQHCTAQNNAHNKHKI